MTEKIIDFPERRAIREEAGAWLIKLDRDEQLGAVELSRLHEWLARGAVHREELSNLARLWDKMNVLTELAVPLGTPEQLTRRSLSKFTGGSLFRFWRLAGVATVLVVGLMFSMLSMFRPDPIVATNGLYATAVGQQQTVKLADGSVVVLNTDSQIGVAFTDGARNIRLLQGEAYFTVAKDANHPFRVFAANGRVQAIGTEFSVYLKDKAVSVTVTEGRVALAAFEQRRQNELTVRAMQLDDGPTSTPEGAPGGSGAIAQIDDSYFKVVTALDAGQTASILATTDEEIEGAQRDAGVENVGSIELERRLSWRDGFLTFSGDPLEDVVREISRYTTVAIAISDPELRTIKIGGRFPVGETDAMFVALETNFGIEVTRMSHDRVLLSMRKN